VPDVPSVVIFFLRIEIRHAAPLPPGAHDTTAEDISVCIT
jgi:hypothetical protein